MTKAELVKEVSNKTNLTKKKAEEVINATFETISQALAKGERLHIPAFGVFYVKERKERTGINPQTGEKITIPAKKVATFKVSKALESKLNEGG